MNRLLLDEIANYWEARQREQEVAYSDLMQRADVQDLIMEMSKQCDLE